MSAADKKNVAEVVGGATQLAAYHFPFIVDGLKAIEDTGQQRLARASSTTTAARERA